MLDICFPCNDSHLFVEETWFLKIQLNFHLDPEHMNLTKERKRVKLETQIPTQALVIFTGNVIDMVSKVGYDIVVSAINDILTKCYFEVIHCDLP